MSREEELRKRILEGYNKSPELLSRVIARVFWSLGKPEHLLVVEQMITDVEMLVGDKLGELIDDIAKRILEYAAAASESKND